jgi:hypothetical protein
MNSVTSARRWVCPRESVLGSFHSAPHPRPLATHFEDQRGSLDTDTRDNNGRTGSARSQRSDLLHARAIPANRGRACPVGLAQVPGTHPPPLPPVLGRGSFRFYLHFTVAGRSTVARRSVGRPRLLPSGGERARSIPGARRQLEQGRLFRVKKLAEGLERKSPDFREAAVAPQSRTSGLPARYASSRLAAVSRPGGWKAGARGCQ